MPTWSLGKLSGRLFTVAFVLLAGGLAKTTISAPSNQPGAWVSIAALAPATFACVLLLILAIKERSAGNLFVFLAGVAGTGMAGLIAFWWTLLLCRGT